MIKKSIEVDGTMIAYLEEGSRQDPCVLMLHGWPETSLIWKDIIPTVVESGFRAIAPDLPGFGLSDALDKESTLERYVSFISFFMAQLNLTHVHLFLHDWGGIIGLKWASQRPSRVLSLLISGTLYTHQAKWHPLADKFRTPQLGEQILAAFADRTRFEHTMKQEIPTVTDRVVEDFYELLSTKEGQELSLQLYRSTNFEELLTEAGKLSRIQTPVTIVWGEKDEHTPQQMAYLIKENELPQAEIHIIPEAGHFIHLACPREVQAFVKRHLNKFNDEVTWNQTTSINDFVPRG